MSDMQLLQQDYQLITMVHSEAIKQVSFASLLRRICQEQRASRSLVNYAPVCSAEYVVQQTSVKLCHVLRAA